MRQDETRSAETRRDEVRAESLSDGGMQDEGWQGYQFSMDPYGSMEPVQKCLPLAGGRSDLGGPCETSLNK